MRIRIPGTVDRHWTLNGNHVLVSSVVAVALTFLFGTAFGAFHTTVALASPTSSSSPARTIASSPSGSPTSSSASQSVTRTVNPVGNVSCASLVATNAVTNYSTGKLTRTATVSSTTTTCTYAWSTGSSMTLVITTDNGSPIWQQFVLAFQRAASQQQMPAMVQINGVAEAFVASSSPADGEELVNQTTVAVIDNNLITLRLVAADNNTLERGQNILTGLSGIMLPSF